MLIMIDQVLQGFTLQNLPPKIFFYAFNIAFAKSLLNIFNFKTVDNLAIVIFIFISKLM